MRALSFVLASCLFLGCATTSRVRDVEQRLDVVEGFLGIQLKRYDDSTWGKKLGGPEASEAVASVGTWVPAQAEKMLLGAGMAGGGGLTYPGSLSLSYLNVGAPTTPATTSGQIRAAGDISGVSFGYSQLTANGITQGMSFSGADTNVRAASGFTVHLNDGAAVVLDVSVASGIQQMQLVGTAGSGTGITANVSASLRSYVHKITVAETALTNASTTQDVTIWTVPAKTHLIRLIADATTGFTGGGLTAMVVQCGKSAGGVEYLPAGGSIFAAATLGDVVAEMGAGLKSASLDDFPNWSSTGTISCRFTSTTANVVAATAGSVTFYIEAVTYP